MRQTLIDECKLICALNSEHIVKLLDVCDYDNRIYAFLELMQGSLTETVKKYHAVYSESFFKYTLYMIAKGL